MIEVMFAVRKDGFKVGIYIMVHFERCPVAQIFSVDLGFHSFEKFKSRRKCELQRDNQREFLSNCKYLLNIHIIN